MKNKVLINITEINDIKKYEKLGYTNFLLPLKGYSVGYKAYTFDEIKDITSNVYIFINRLLNDDDIDEFIKLDIPKNIKGFIIEDTGLLSILSNKGYELINYQNHLNNNYKTINYWLNYFDSVVLNNDITYDEIKEILEKSSKPLVINTYGYPVIMYSRRTLLTNYDNNYNLDINKDITVNEKVSNHPLKLYENEYGTCVFDDHITDYRECMALDNVKFFIFNTKYLTFDEVKLVLEGKHLDNETLGFLHTKTVYKIGDLK